MIRSNSSGAKAAASQTHTGQISAAIHASVGLALQELDHWSSRALEDDSGEVTAAFACSCR